MVAAISVEGEVLDHKTVVLPSSVFIDGGWDQGFASATGTWAVDGKGTIWNTEQVSQIECFRDRGECVEALTSVAHPQTSNNHVLVGLDYYGIEKWNRFEIITKPREKGCRHSVIRFNRPQKRVTAFESAAACHNSEDSYRVLSDGFKISYDLDKAETRRQLALFAPRVFGRLSASNK
jgi:hypothetical protein